MDAAAPAPGIMPSQALARAVRDGWIRSAASPVPEANVQPASLDLRLGEVPTGCAAASCPRAARPWRRSSRA